MTTQCIQECLKRGIPVSFMSKGGRYFGRLHSTGHINTERQRMQCALYDTDFSVELAKRIMSAKLRNQGVVLRRYEKSNNLEESENIKAIKRYREKLNQCTRIDEIMGYEGQAAKTYFEGISAGFCKRKRQLTSLQDYRQRTGDIIWCTDIIRY